MVWKLLQKIVSAPVRRPRPVVSVMRELAGQYSLYDGKFRDVCLGMEWFMNRMDAKILIENRRRHYNEVRPHSSLGNLTPSEFKQQLSQQCPM